MKNRDIKAISTISTQNAGEKIAFGHTFILTSQLLNTICVCA